MANPNMNETTEEMITSEAEDEKVITLEEYHQIIGLVAIQENAHIVANDAERAIRDLLDPKIDVNIIESLLLRGSTPQQLIQMTGFKVDFRR